MMTWILLVASLCLVSANVSPASLATLSKFETPTGLVDDCCCTVDNVNQVNSKHIAKSLDDLVHRKFFKYFKVNLELECPFWVVTKTCGLSGGCSVCKCDENEVPLMWKSETTSQIDRQVGADFNPWVDDQKLMWLKPESETDSIYVDLSKNPEVNTGYVGPEAQKVWAVIYSENCFNGQSQCMEERVYFRLISGLHSAITAHIFRNFYRQSEGWKPNLEGFVKALGAFPDRMKNLYFTYLFLLRAVDRATPFLEQYDYSTGNPDYDKETKRMVQHFLELKKQTGCREAFGGFNESELFSSKEKVFLKQQMQEKFRNVSSILNCISCESCRLLARVKILGIGAALKILFEERQNVHLQRNEIIALINTLQQFSDSVRIVGEMEELKNIQLPSGSASLLPSYSSPLNIVSIFAASTLIAIIAAAFMFVRRSKTKSLSKKAKAAKST